MTKHSVRDGRALAASIRAGREHDTHGNLYARPNAPLTAVWHAGYLPAPFQTALDTDYVIGSYGTPIAWRAPIAALDALTAAGLYREKGSGATHYGADYIAYRVPGEDKVWIYPLVRYSASTGTHQHTTRHALQELGADVVRYL